MKQCRVIKIENGEVMIEAGIPDFHLAYFIKTFDGDGYKVQVREHTEKDTEEFWKDVKGGIVF